MKEKKYVYYHNKKSGTTYVIQNFPYWDKEKKQPRSKRKYIGTLNKEDGEIIPSKGRVGKKKHIGSNIIPDKRSFYGATYLLNTIGEKLGIIDDLKKCFPKKYKHILSIAYFMVLEDHAPLYRFEKWSELHYHPLQRNIHINSFDKLFVSIAKINKSTFLKLLDDRCKENVHWDFDLPLANFIDNYNHTEHNNIEGKLFVTFIALIFISYINNKLSSKAYYKNLKLTTILDKLDLIERFEYKNNVYIAELKYIQKKIYKDLKIPTP